MNRIEQLKSKLETARDEVMVVLNRPKLTGELIEELGYSGMNFLLTKQIGDAAGEWDDSPHQLALSDLIDEGQIQWQRDESLNVMYALKGTWSLAECGDDSPIIGRIGRFFDEIVAQVDVPWIPRDQMHFNERETIGHGKHGTEGMVRVIYYGESVCVEDMDMDCGEDEEMAITKFPWPVIESSPEKVVGAVLDAIGRVK